MKRGKRPRRPAARSAARSPREHDAEGSSFLGGRTHLGGSSVGLRDLVDDEQAEADAAGGAGGVGRGSSASKMRACTSSAIGGPQL